MARDIILKTGLRKTSVDRSEIQFAVKEASSDNNVLSKGIIKVSGISEDVISKLKREQRYQIPLNMRNIYKTRIRRRKNAATKLRAKNAQRKTSK